MVNSYTSKREARDTEEKFKLENKLTNIKLFSIDKKTNKNIELPLPLPLLKTAM